MNILGNKIFLVIFCIFLLLFFFLERKGGRYIYGVLITDTDWLSYWSVLCM